MEEGIKTLRRENNKSMEKGIKKLRRAIKLKRERVSKTLYFVLKRASLSLPSLICTIRPPKFSEPELGQSQQQEIGRA